MRSLLGVFGWVGLLLLLSSAAAWCDSPPNIYVGVGSAWDLEDDEQFIGPAIKFGGTRKLTPDFGIYNGKILIGGQYLILGTRSELKRVYGGPGVVWYDGDWGGSFTVGTHLSREVIVEGSYRWTPNWDGAASVCVAYGLNWRFLGR